VRPEKIHLPFEGKVKIPQMLINPRSVEDGERETYSLATITVEVPGHLP